MPKFLTRQEIYSLIERELPEEVFAFSTDPKDFYTTSDDDSFAKTVESSYTLLERIYANYFPQDADEKISDWEITVFNEVDGNGSTLTERRDAVLTHLRSQKGITVQDLRDIVYTCIGTSHDVEIIEKGCEGGTWILGKSRLSRSTFLGVGTTVGLQIPSDFNLCQDDAHLELGITADELEKLQNQAYSYEVRIFGYTATASELECLEKKLTRFERGVTKHTIISPFAIPVVKPDWKLGTNKLSNDTYLG